MPYITQELRGYLNGHIIQILNNINNSKCANSNSQMAYVIYKLIKQQYGNKPTWEQKSDALKILEDVKLEYYDKVLRPYANLKMELNGDV